MIILDATTKSLQINLSANVTTNQLPFSASYVDSTGSATTPGEQDGTSNNTTAATVVSAPAASTQRLIKSFILQNADTAAAKVTVIYNNNSTLRNILVVTLAVGDQLVYEDEKGWNCLTSNGNMKSAATGGTGAVSSVSNTDGTIIVSPTTGDAKVSAAINGIANTNLAKMAAGTYKGNPTAASANASDSTLPPFGNCQLQRSSSTQVTLMPWNGNQVTFPNGYIYSIGSSGLASGSINGGCYLNGTANSTLTAGTLYYCYLWYNNGSPVLDFSTTGHAVDSTTGIVIKSGDNTRVLVGMIYPQTGPTVADSGAARLVASWFNRQPKMGSANFTANRSTTSTSEVEINSEIRVAFLSWGDSASCQFSGSGTNNTTGDATYSTFGLDGTSTLFGGTIANAYAGGQYKDLSFSASTIPSEGEHFVTLVGETDTGTTSTWYGTSAPWQCTIYVTVVI
jgi:hypothetical protein